MDGDITLSMDGIDGVIWYSAKEQVLDDIKVLQKAYELFAP